MSVFAYFGPAGTFTEMALDRLLLDERVRERVGTQEPRKLAAASPAAAIAMVRAGEADFACVPIESSLEGSVPATMDAMVSATDADRVQFFAETALPIAFTVVAATQLRPEQVHTIAGYPVATAQVRETIEKTYPEAGFVISGSNSAAAQDVLDGKADAAITTPLAAAALGLTVLADGVSDVDDATTRFLLAGRPAAPAAATGADRTSVMLELPNTPGSLMAAMNEFASRGVDLSRIESRPWRNHEGGRSVTAGRYRFFLDAVGHIDDAAVAEALRALHRRTDRTVYLGSWPAVTDDGSRPPSHTESFDWLAGIRNGATATGIHEGAAAPGGGS